MDFSVVQWWNEWYDKKRVFSAVAHHSGMWIYGVKNVIFFFFVSNKRNIININLTQFLDIISRLLGIAEKLRNK